MKTARFLALRPPDRQDCRPHRISRWPTDGAPDRRRSPSGRFPLSCKRSPPTTGKLRHRLP